ncbi:hypothetical protein OEZ85_010755 [Tetradesmus obliquus]|uniref:Peptidase M43 pregnancy-associated plasma-A domain-containing protein n=1 Tax=Tetradesmus obliquus TaxID=3088 RepID=A0ABY8TQB7_TETOB|nr:hypothetical protein OEZ85_010755 [Tetradesmus obliquus]
MRLVRRLEKGPVPRPNCTAEEFALHRIISMARDFWHDGVDDAVADVIEALPCSTLDEDFDLVSEVAFQDHDVLMLFDTPRLIHPSGLAQNFGLANLHPDGWFKPFDTGLTSNHAAAISKGHQQLLPCVLTKDCALPHPREVSREESPPPADAPVSERRCATDEGTKEKREAAERRFKQRLQQIKRRGEGVSIAQAAPVIQVYFHVMTLNNRAGVVSRERINAQIATLNAAFSSAFSFQLVSAQQYSTSSKRVFNAGYGSRGELDTKAALRQGSATTLNIYTWEPERGILGWATFPSDYQPVGSARIRDGVVLLHSSVNGGSAVPHNLGDTAVHEVGHWLGLYHTFQGGCGTTDTANSGDFVPDTPAVGGPNYGCPIGINTCIDAQGPDLVKNFMDYTNDNCMDSFTSN